MEIGGGSYWYIMTKNVKNKGIFLYNVFPTMNDLITAYIILDERQKQIFERFLDTAPIWNIYQK